MTCLTKPTIDKPVQRSRTIRKDEADMVAEFCRALLSSEHKTLPSSYHTKISYLGWAFGGNSLEEFRRGKSIRICKLLGVLVIKPANNSYYK